MKDIKRYLTYSIPGCLGVLLFWYGMFSGFIFDHIIFHSPVHQIENLWDMWPVRFGILIVTAVTVHVAFLTPLSMAAEKAELL